MKADLISNQVRLQYLTCCAYRAKACILADRGELTPRVGAASVCLEAVMREEEVSVEELREFMKSDLLSCSIALMIAKSFPKKSDALALQPLMQEDISEADPGRLLVTLSALYRMTAELLDHGFESDEAIIARHTYDFVADLQGISVEDSIKLMQTDAKACAAQATKLLADDQG